MGLATTPSRNTRLDWSSANYVSLGSNETDIIDRSRHGRCYGQLSSDVMVQILTIFGLPKFLSMLKGGVVGICRHAWVPKIRSYLTYLNG